MVTSPLYASDNLIVATGSPWLGTSTGKDQEMTEVPVPSAATQYFWFRPLGLTLAELSAFAAALGFQGPQ